MTHSKYLGKYAVSVNCAGIIGFSVDFLKEISRYVVWEMNILWTPSEKLDISARGVYTIFRQTCQVKIVFCYPSLGTKIRTFRADVSKHYFELCGLLWESSKIALFSAHDYLWISVSWMSMFEFIHTNFFCSKRYLPVPFSPPGRIRASYFFSPRISSNTSFSFAR